jgi:hypothetical protein
VAEDTPFAADLGTADRAPKAALLARVARVHSCRAPDLQVRTVSSSPSARPYQSLRLGPARYVVSRVELRCFHSVSSRSVTEPSATATNVRTSSSSAGSSK